MFKCEIKIKKTSENDFLTYKITKCNFCDKKSSTYNYYHNIYQQASKNNFYCNFCLRNEFYNINCKDLMILTFNPIIEKYYKLYLKKRIFYSEVLDFIESHKNTGLLHHAFYYDDDSLKWFINLTKINKNTLIQHLLNILCCFNINEITLNTKSTINKIINYVDNFKSNKQKKLNIGGNMSTYCKNNIIQI